MTRTPWSHKPPLLNGRSEIEMLEGARKLANPLPTFRQPFANPLPTPRQPFANLFCQPLSNPLFPWTPGTRLETRVNGFLGCDPECLLQGPETSNVPKVVRRGCKKSFGPREQRSPKSLLHHLNPVLHRCNSLLHQCKRTLPPGPKRPFAPLLTTLG